MVNDKMSYLDKLLEGVEVEWKTLGDLAVLSNTGVDKKVKENEQKVRLLNFVEVFHNQYITNKTPTMVVSASDKKIKDCSIKKGDVFITPSSELIDEIGQSAMAVEDFENAVYSYHIMRIRIKDFTIIHPAFLNYLFNSQGIRKYIRSKSQGITRFGLTKPNWEALPVPTPPLSVQKEIVRILDKFTELTAELTAELIAREKQYEYYRDKLFSFNKVTGGGYKWMTMSDVGIFMRGKRFVKDDMVSEGIPCIHYGEMYTHYGTWAKESKSFLKKELVESKKLRIAEPGDIVIVAAGETIEDIGMGTAWLGQEGVVIHDACFSFRSPLNSKYVAYFTRTRYFHNQIKRHITSGKISAINERGLSKALIPVPPIEEQERIVSILDKFDTLTNSISEGLPREIELRQKQYEYYREKLLNFNCQN